MDEVEISEYNPKWPELFLVEKSAIATALSGQDILAIEHFGSTAIPGLAAKPVIDILIAVPSVSHARQTFVPLLKSLDYVFWAENPNTDRLFFVKGMPPFGERRTHHVHVAQKPSEMWSRLKFRDYLRLHDDERTAYAQLKRGLSQKYSADREAYTAAKSEFVARVMLLAESV